jgi:hypothetical protein
VQQLGNRRIVPKKTGPGLGSGAPKDAFRCRCRFHTSAGVIHPRRRDADFAKAREANPDGKFIYVFSDIKPHVSGDVAVVTYTQKSTAA